MHVLQDEALPIPAGACEGAGAEAGGALRQAVAVVRPVKVARGQKLFGDGEPLVAVYEVLSGMFKTCICTVDGRQQVTGFQGPGDWLGVEGLDTRHHSLDATALTDSQVRPLDYLALDAQMRADTRLQHAFHRMMSREIVRHSAMLLVLGSLQAEARLASFLLDLALAQNLAAAPEASLLLPMTREEIGSYLGLQVETVSRGFSRLHADGVLEVHHRRIRVLDLPALRRAGRRPA